MLLSLLLIIAQCTSLISTAPVANPSSLSERTLYCSNIPNQVAGSPSSKRTLHSPRAPAYAYCVRSLGNRTFILITFTSLYPAGPISQMLNTAMEFVTNAVNTSGDRNIPGGFFQVRYANLLLRVQNANNHQVTYGVLGAALIALGDWMQEQGKWGALTFEVWDGDNQVGSGGIGGG
ncbi:hypothetical protein MMC08_004725 [Hypocenomyce scalaris]|nr:hypothetical protein [Hypocenomyce scalaris]